MERLLIVGAGPMGREILDWVEDIPEAERPWSIGGFLDNRRDILDKYQVPYPILGDPETFELQPGDRLVCAVGDPKARLELCAQLEARGARFATVQHPLARVGRRCRIGDGSVLAPWATVDCDVTIGRHVILYFRAGIGHDTILGDGCQLSTQATVCGLCQLGRGVLVGTTATVLPRTTVGDFASVSAGSAARKRVESGQTVIGIPARPLRTMARRTPRAVASS